MITTSMFKKQTILIIVLLIVLLCGVFFAYQWWQIKGELRRQIEQNTNLTKQVNDLQEEIKNLKSTERGAIQQTINALCKKDQELIEKIQADSDCLEGKGFRCIDGWEIIWHFDKRLVNTELYSWAGFPSDMPEELSRGVIAEYFRSTCACEKPIYYQILVENKLKEITCEEFYKFIEDYDSSCNGCILTTSFHHG